MASRVVVAVRVSVERVRVDGEVGASGDVALVERRDVAMLHGMVSLDSRQPIEA